MSKGHSTACADAVRTTPDECECKCRGLFHGGPHSERARALVWDPDGRKSYSRARVSEAKRSARDALAAARAPGVACTDYAAVHAIDELIQSADGDDDALTDVLAAVLSPFVASIVEADLDADDSKRIDAAASELHLLCSLAVAVLKVVDDDRTLSPELANQVARDVLAATDSQMPLTEPVREAMHAALVGSFGALIGLALPTNLPMLRLIGFLSCPDASEHPEVEEYCIRPLVGGWVTGPMHDWVTGSFSADSAVLRRARPSRRRKP